MTETPPLLLTVVQALLSLAFVMAFIRLLRGPSLPDRVVAFEVMTTIGIGFICVYAVSSHQKVYLDVASVMAILSFLATTAFAYYLGRKESSSHGA
jgi:multicomponent Na+:H+ antiporter subunit F